MEVIPARMPDDHVEKVPHHLRLLPFRGDYRDTFSISLYRRNKF
jgi:hypothetical protein